MLKKNTKLFKHPLLVTSSALELVTFPLIENSKRPDSGIEDKVVAIQTSRLSPFPANYQVNSPYQYFNLGLHVGDSPIQVAKNREKLRTLLPNNTEIQWLEQVHGSEVAKISEVSSQPITADAVITRKNNICLAIMTADCLPILLSSKQGDEIAAIHGGWRSLATNIVSNTLSKMDTNASELCVWLGPCIGSAAFEVGQEVLDTFVNQNQVFFQAFTQHGSGKYLANLQKIAKIQLAQLGVTNISALSKCTFSNSDKYYSYRKNPITGRMASLICIR